MELLRKVLASTTASDSAVAQVQYRPLSFGRWWPRLHPGVWLFAALVFAGSLVLLPNGGQDWRNAMVPAAHAWWPEPWESAIPYPPYLGIILSPLGGLPFREGTAINNVAAVIVVALVIHRFGGPWWGVVVVFLTPSGIWHFANGQVDWLALAGLFWFNGLDLVFFMLKPQVALWVVVARLRRAGASWWRYLSPASAMLATSLVIWPLWPVHVARVGKAVIDDPYNASLWPWSLPLGAFLVWKAWQTGDDRYGLAASPLLFPYVNWPSYLGLLTILVSRWPRATLAAWAVTWGGGMLLFLAGS